MNSISIVLRRIGTLPAFENEAKTRVASFLNLLLMFSLFIISLNYVIIIFFAPELVAPAFPTHVVLITSLIGAIYALRRGYVTAPGVTFCALIWLAQTLNLYAQGGLYSPYFGLYGILIIITGTVFGWRGAIIAGISSIAATLVLFVFQQSGNLPPFTLGYSLPPVASAYVGTWAVVMTLFAIFDRSLKGALERALRDEHILAERNQELQREIAEREKAQKAQARLAAILELSTDFVGTADPSGKVVYINPAGCRLLGIHEDEIGQYHVVDFFTPEVYQTVRAQLTEATKAGTWMSETVMLTRTGEEIPVSQLTIVHKGSDGQVEYNSTIIRDIRDRKQAEQERLELALQKQRVELLQEFMANISHDLKTPLTTINTGLYLLEKADTPEKQKEKIEAIKSQAQLLEKYIQDILLISKLDHAPALQLAPLDFNLLLRDIEKRLKPSAEEKNLTLTFTLDSSLPAVRADEGDLFRALVNLIENAIHYTPVGSSVTVRTYAQGEGVVAEVADTGIGISSTDLPRIFERFYRADQARSVQAGGTGLGLAIVQKIVEMHGGHIDVRAEPGKGSTFALWLPKA